MSSNVGVHERRGRPDAAMTIWHWRDDDAIDAAPSGAGAARLRGLLQSGFGLTVAGLIYWFVSTTAGLLIGTVASVILLCAMLSPLGAFAKIESVFNKIGHGIGVGVTWLTLGLLFFGFFFPFGLLFRRGEKDNMKRFYSPKAESYWTQRSDAASSADSYRQQF